MGGGSVISINADDGKWDGLSEIEGSRGVDNYRPDDTQTEHNPAQTADISALQHRVGKLEANELEICAQLTEMQTKLRLTEKTNDLARQSLEYQIDHLRRKLAATEQQLKDAKNRSNTEVTPTSTPKPKLKRINGAEVKLKNFEKKIMGPLGKAFDNAINMFKV